MGEYTNVKRKKMEKFLNWLSRKDNVVVVKGGKHVYTVKYFLWGRPYPMPFRHNEVNKFIVNGLVKKLMESK